MTDYDIVICGAGPGGLVLAATLGRRGLRVLVCEKQKQPVEQYKGEVLQPRSQQILQELGLLGRLTSAGVVHADELECRDASGTRLVALDYARLSTPFNRVSVHYYHEIQQTLANELPPTVRLEYGSGVQELVRGERGRVIGVRIGNAGDEPRTVYAALVVGADGQGSRCRTLAGLETGKVSRYEHDLFGFDFPDEGSLPARLTAYVTTDGLRLLYPMPHGRGRLYVQVPIGASRDIRRAGLNEWLVSVSDAVPDLRDVVATLIRSDELKAQTLPARRCIAPAWWTPGLVIIGDAAHSVHPMAGQGMNSAIADAAALAETLTETDWGAGTVPDALLAEYERSRRPGLQYISQISHHLSMAFTSTSPTLQAISKRMMLRNEHNIRLQHILTYNMSGLGLRPMTFRDRFYQLGVLSDPRANTVSLT
ncbi:NAD(P)/FAD-dependent oxidoreductase [Nocardia sp. NPDC005825]|uniref:FAD-dependent oxidoreductase n=1 Tax=unclassified Nocardia TaxID=2637762 RepID=UPI0033E62AC7